MFCGRFTHYQYQLEVHNDMGFSTGEMVDAVTMAGIPHHRPSLSAYAINHTAVQVNWTQPSKNNLSYYNQIDMPIVFLMTVIKQRKTYSLLIYSSFVMFSFFPALQDLQGEVESYFLSVEAALFFQNLILPPKTVSTIISGLWPSTTYLVSLQVSNGAHNTTKASVKVTTEDGGTVCVYLCGFWR